MTGFIEEIKGLLTEFYEPNKKARYVELHNRVFPLDKLDENCRYCGSKAYYKLNELINQSQPITMAAEKKAVTYELVNPGQIATVKLFDRRITLDTNTDQITLQAAYNAGHTAYVKKVGE